MEPLPHSPNRFCALNLLLRSQYLIHLALAMNFDDVGDANDVANVVDALQYQLDHQHQHHHQQHFHLKQLLWLLTLVLHQCQLNTVVAVVNVVVVAVDAAVAYHAVLYVYVSYTVVSLCDYPN